MVAAAYVAKSVPCLRRERGRETPTRLVVGEGDSAIAHLLCLRQPEILVDLRERWTLPLRILGLYGDYKHATILESLGGILRIEFAEGQVRWALPHL